MTTAPAIETSGLTKSYGSIQAVSDLTMTVAPGCITAFLGLNGAGKTTTIKMLLGMISPSSGQGKVLGRSIHSPDESVELRRKVAYVSESLRLYEYMTVAQMIRFTRSFYPGWCPDTEKMLLRTYELPPNRKVKSLSKGMQRKLALLLAFARKPELLILDEPSDGLDPVGVEQLLEKMVSLCAGGTSIFFSSHQIAEVERVADRVCMIHRGRLVMDASLDHIRESYRQIDLVFNAVPDKADLQMPGVENILVRGHQMRILVTGNAEAVLARARDYYPSSVDVAPINLREVFLERVKES
ncbi:MAG: ATP-binding cassette domain-containing protein [Acidobacteriota bacterium]